MIIVHYQSFFFTKALLDDSCVLVKKFWLLLHFAIALVTFSCCNICACVLQVRKSVVASYLTSARYPVLLSQLVLWQSASIAAVPIRWLYCCDRVSLPALREGWNPATSFQVTKLERKCYQTNYESTGWSLVTWRESVLNLSQNPRSWRPSPPLLSFEQSANRF